MKEDELSFICILDEVNSTNLFLENFAINFKGKRLKPLIVFSKFQSSGKGRGDNVFLSPRGGLYFSLLLSNIKPKVYLPLQVGIYFSEKISNFTKLPIEVRWPNDLIIKDEKIGGILIEVKGEKVIIGVGVNVEKSLARKVKDQKTGYLNKYLEDPIKVKDLYELVINWIDHDFFNFIKEPLNLKKWEDYSYFKINDKLIWQEKGEYFEGIYKGITKEGFLKVDFRVEEKKLLTVDKIMRI